MMVKLGYVEKVEYYLRKRKTPVSIEVFSDVEPDPSVDTVERGTAMMDRFQPDCIIALRRRFPDGCCQSHVVVL